MMKNNIIKVVILIVVVLVIIKLNYILISYLGTNKTYDNYKNIPKNKVGLVLGTSKRTKTGQTNLYFLKRIDAVCDLYKNDKIDYILVSGDNSSKYYDEPTDFKETLVERGIPEEKIYLDYAGFRTLDSIVRAKEIFGQSKITIISQKFHNERALFIAKFKNIDAIAYNAKDVRYVSHYSIKVYLREHISRVKLLLDIIFDKKPKFLGEKIKIGSDDNETR